MNYKKIYFDLVKKRIKIPANLQYDYTETHHIIPVSIDPTKAKLKINLVILSARQHFIAHALLVKIYKQTGQKNKWYKMLCAFDAMSKLYGSIRNTELRYKNKSTSKLYEIWIVELSNYIKTTGCKKGKNATQYGKLIYHNIKLNKVKYFKKDEIIPEGWLPGTGGLVKSSQGSLNKKWLYNSITNKQICIDKDKIQLFLINNPEYKLGRSPESKTHIQHYNPSKDKKWITNIQLKQSKTIYKNEELPKGWLIGRVADFDKFMQKYNDALTQHKKWHFIDYQLDITNKIVPRILKNKPKKAKKENKNIKKYLLSKLDTKKEKIELLKLYLEEYKLNKYKGVVQKFNYKYSRIALYKAFKKYIPNEFNQYQMLKKELN